MSERIKLSYFYGKEADQYTFYKIPKLLFRDGFFKDLTLEAKVLYGLMLDRMSLSVKNQWLDSEGRAYIFYGIEEMMEDLSCKNNKISAVLKELDRGTGIGLIERKRQGQGKPTMIYVMQFVVQSVQKVEKPMSGEKEDIPDMGKTNVLTIENPTSRDGKNQCLDMGKTHANKNNINNTESNEILSYPIPSVIPEGEDEEKDGIRSDASAYAELIRENIELDLLMDRYPLDKELAKGIYDLILETVLCENADIVISGSKYPMELVRGKFLRLNSMHVEYVIGCLKQNTTKVRNIKKYLLAALFNAPSTISGYYQAEVNHDMPQFAAQR